jgi:hypothetical protein
MISVLFVIVCRLRLLSVPLERDEGEYAYVGQQLLHGIPPFVSIYHVKLPGIYAGYALVMAVFGQTCEGIHLGLMCINLLTGLMLYLIAKRIFNPVIAAYAASVFLVINLSRTIFGFTANAEQFVLLPAMFGIWILLEAIALADSKQKIRSGLFFFLSGFMMGLAYLMKQHGIFFAAFAGIFFLYRSISSPPVRWRDLLVNGLVFMLGASLPLALVCLIFFKLGLFDRFWWWTWYYPRIYVSRIPWSDGWQYLKIAVRGIPHTGLGIWRSLWATIIMAAWGLAAIVYRRDIDRAVFAISWTVLSIVAVSFGLYFYPHYFQLATPAVALLVAVGCESLLFFWKGRKAVADSIYPGLPALLLVCGTYIYREKVYLFEMDGNEVSHAIYGNSPFAEAIEIGKYIAQNSSPTDKVAILGSEPEVLFYADRRSATGYIYTYELFKPHPFEHQMQVEMAHEIDSARPKYILLVNVQASWYAVPNEHVDTFFNTWVSPLLHRAYAPVGLIDLTWPYPDRYCWDRAGVPCQPSAERYLQLYLRQGNPTLAGRY